MRQCNILFTSVGRRVSLINYFRRALKELEIDGKIVGVDASNKSPAFYITDKSYKVPRITAPEFIPRLLDICKHENIKVLIPLIDTELAILAKNRERFKDAGTMVIISAPEVIKIGMYKTETQNFFRTYDIDTPMLYSNKDIECGTHDFPLLIKPDDGSAGRMVFKVENEVQLEFFKNYVPNAVVQEFIEGDEYTLDIFTDFTGKVRCVVPRLRIEVRAGEVSKSLIIKNKGIIAAGEKVAECLPGTCGCITVQCIVDKQSNIKMIEINPRFGGGVPLSIEAGANFPRWIIQMVTGQEIGDIKDCYRDGLMMLRYDDAIFVKIPVE